MWIRKKERWVVGTLYYPAVNGLVHGADQALGEVEDELEDRDEEVDDQGQEREQEPEYRLEDGVNGVHGDIVANSPLYSALFPDT